MLFAQRTARMARLSPIFCLGMGLGATGGPLFQALTASQVVDCMASLESIQAVITTPMQQAFSNLICGTPTS